MSDFDRFLRGGWPYAIIAAIDLGMLVGVVALHVAGVR